MTIRTRIAPSPTGFMHIGTLRTALTNFLFAKKHKGQFIVRLEDTDRTRFIEGSAEDIVQSLKWAGLSWEEGIDLDSHKKIIQKGQFGPYIQSERLEIYQKYSQQLVDQGHAYYCFCSPQRLEKMRNEQRKQKTAPRYDKKCCKLPLSKVKEKIRKGESHTIRLRVPEKGSTEFNDLVRKKISIENRLIDDQILIKSDGFPTYHFAVVVDDHLMKISHVLRGEEWLSSTPKHLLLFQAFGWDPPQFGHLPQLLNLNGKKLSKRDGDISVKDFIKKGYLSEALINFIALLGWNPKTSQEIFSLKQLISQFDVGKINKSGAKFDYNRLNWFNAHYIKKLSPADLYQKAKPFLKNTGLTQEKAQKVITVQKERVNKLSDFTLDLDYLIKENINYPQEMLFWKNQEKKDLLRNLRSAKKILQAIDNNEFSLENIQNQLLEAAKQDRGALLWPLRVALTGQKQSPSPFECTWILGKKTTLKRIAKAIEML